MANSMRGKKYLSCWHHYFVSCSIRLDSKLNIIITGQSKVHTRCATSFTSLFLIFSHCDNHWLNNETTCTIINCIPKIEVLNAQTYNVYILYACAFSTTDAHSRVMHYVHELRTSLHYRITTLMLTCWMDLANIEDFW